MAADYNVIMKALGKFMFMSLLLMAIPFFASNFKFGTLISTVFLVFFAVLVWIGVFKNAPKRNALAVLPALSFSAAYLYYVWNGSIPNFPWAVILLALWMVCAALFTYREFRGHTT